MVLGISFPETVSLVLQVIADNVGDNVGDIAGMGSDLFGSYAESSCAALVVASISSFGINHDFTGMCYPLLISSVGIIVCLITTLFATDFFEVKDVDQIEPALKKQLVISTTLMTVGIAIISWLALPAKFTIFNFGAQKEVTNWYVLVTFLLNSFVENVLSSDVMASQGLVLLCCNWSVGWSDHWICDRILH
jgi:Na+/H+-translocating membrane pyrophosphatase